jgi:biotin operon repressor
MKLYQDTITQLGQERRKLWHDIWKDGTSQQKIADACGISRQQVFLEIKRYMGK